MPRRKHVEIDCQFPLDGTVESLGHAQHAVRLTEQVTLVGNKYALTTFLAAAVEVVDGIEE